MPRPTLRSSDWPFPLNMLVRVLELLSSAALATVAIALSAAVLGWATWLESNWGVAAVQFGVYQSTWFAVLLGLLGMNVLAAAVVRFPWRKKQTGFLLVHAGILMLLIGCWMTRQGGVDGQMSLLEGDSSSTVVEPGLHFELAIVPAVASGDTSAGDGGAKLVDVPFRPGPFNWEDYQQLGWFPWALVGRDGGVVYDRDGVKLEVLDYYSDSRRTPVPELKLRVGRGRSADKLDADAWESVTLTVRSFGKNHTSSHGSTTHGSTAVGAWRELGHGEIVFFRLAMDKAETEAFLDSRPVGPLGRSGQIVLHAGGEKFHFLVSDLKVGQPVPLGKSGLAAELLEFNRRRLQVALDILRLEDKGDGNKQKNLAARRVGALVLHGFQANLDRQDHKNGVYGSFWFDPKGDKNIKGDASKPVSRPIWTAAGRPRLDIIQGHDEKLYYRTWRAPRLGTVGPLPADGSKTVVFDRKAFALPVDGDKKGRDAADEVIPATVYVASFTPSARPGVEIRPLPFKKGSVKAQRVKLRLSVDGNSQEFWLANAAATDAEDERRRFAKGDTRSAAVQLVNNTQELGFSVALDDFQRRLDPGTSRASGYSSRIDFVDKSGGKILAEDVVVSLNQPAGFTDPVDGRTYRFFQSSFSGPYRPGDWEFDQAIGGRRQGDELYRSTFSVASDPGRQLKYAGCLMIVAGIVVMYYMKAYFFRKRGK